MAGAILSVASAGIVGSGGRSRAAEPLSDGRKVEIRAQRPEDREAVHVTVQRLSPETFCHRFFESKHEFPEQEAHLFLDIDFVGHLVLVAVANESGGTPFIPPNPAALPGKFIAEVQIFRGFWMVSWFKQQFGHPEVTAAPIEGVSSDALLDRLVQDAPPESEGLMLQPYWTPGIRTPGPEARGAVIGFTDTHTRAHLFRAILEGLAYALREGCERIQARSGVRVASLRVSGTGSQSKAAMQATADIFNWPTSRPHTFETSGLGTAISGAVGVGLHRDFSTAVGEMTRLGATFEPNPSHAALYEQLYTRVYKRMYRRLAPLYEDLHRTLRQAP